MKPGRETVRRFVAAALCDLVAAISKEENPIVVGGDYPNTKLIQAVKNWAAIRQVSLENPDGVGWVAACKNGTLKRDELGA